MMLVQQGRGYHIAMPSPSCQTDILVKMLKKQNLMRKCQTVGSHLHSPEYFAFFVFLFFLNGFAWLSYGIFALFAFFAFLMGLHYPHLWDAVSCRRDQKWLSPMDAEESAHRGGNTIASRRQVSNTLQDSWPQSQKRSRIFSTTNPSAFCCAW